MPMSRRTTILAAALALSFNVVNILAPAAPASAAPACTITGTPRNDRLGGTPGDDVICGLGGDDVMWGAGGEDVFIGGPGRDTVGFGSAGQAVTVDLAAGTATGAFGTDKLKAIENLRGSRFNDRLAGDANSNLLWGMGGNDTLFGGGGGDVPDGGGGKDVLDGQGGPDYLSGGTGDDVLRGGPESDGCRQGTGSGPARSCFAEHVGDPAEGRGRLDVRGVVHGGLSPWWRIRTARSWTTREMQDRGYLIVWLDTHFDGRPDYHALVRSTGDRMEAELFRETSSQPQSLGSIPAWRPGGRSVAVKVPLDRLEFGPSRIAFHWHVQTLYTGAGCEQVCFDLVPASGDIPAPVPGLL
jgi:hypothetical protein